MEIAISTFKQIFKAHYESLCRSAFRIVQDKDVSEDLVQDLFFQVWQKQLLLDDEAQMRSYLHKSVINQSLNYLRGQKNRLKREEDFGMAIPREVNATDEMIYFKDLQDKVNRAIGTLPPSCRTILILNRFEHLSYKEIAERLNISIKTVENQMVKALKHLRKHLNPAILIFLEIFC